MFAIALRETVHVALEARARFALRRKVTLEARARVRASLSHDAACRARSARGGRRGRRRRALLHLDLLHAREHRRPVFGDVLGEHGRLKHPLDRGPVGGALGEQLADERAQLGRIVHRHRQHAPAHDLHHQPVHVVCIEGVLEGGQLVQHAAQRPHVALVAVGLTLHELG